MSGQSSYQLAPIRRFEPMELDDHPGRSDGVSLQAQGPNDRALQNSIRATDNQDRTEREGWRGLTQDQARDILQQQGIEVTQENVEYLRQDWAYESAGCTGLVAALRSNRPSWGNFQTGDGDFSRRTSLGNAQGLSLGVVKNAFEARLKLVVAESLAAAKQEAASNAKYARVMDLQRRRGVVDLEGQNDLNLDSQMQRLSARIIDSPSYRLSLSAFVTRYNDLFRFLYALQTGANDETAAQQKEALLELCKEFKTARGELDAAWTGLEDYREKIMAASRSIIDDAFASANADDTTSRSRSGLNWQRTGVVGGGVAASLTLSGLLLHYLMGAGG